MFSWVDLTKATGENSDSQGSHLDGGAVSHGVEASGQTTNDRNAASPTALQKVSADCLPYGVIRRVSTNATATGKVGSSHVCAGAPWDTIVSSSTMGSLAFLARSNASR